MSYTGFINVDNNFDFNSSGNDGYQLYIINISGNKTITLPSYPWNGQTYYLSRKDNNILNTCTLDAGSNTIDGSSSKNLPASTEGYIIFDNGNWIYTKYTIS
jgi:hypothetical protein